MLQPPAHASSKHQQTEIAHPFVEIHFSSYHPPSIRQFDHSIELFSLKLPSSQFIERKSHSVPVHRHFQRHSVDIMIEGPDVFDYLVWDKNDEEWEIVQPKLRQRSTLHAVEDLGTAKFGSTAKWVSPMSIGGYNIIYRLKVEGFDSEVLVRRPIPCYAQFPVEKTSIEAATMMYLEKHTKIPVARTFFHGEDPKLGSFIIMEYIEHPQCMSTAHNATNEDVSKPFTLNPDIPEEVLQNHYQHVAACLLELSQHTFPRIGSLVEVNPGTFSIAARPVTKNMNDMLQLANIPGVILPPQLKTYQTVDEYYVWLAEMHIAQLVFQQNDLVRTEQECRNKYVARQLFRRLARDGKLSKFGFKEDNWSAQSKTKSMKLSSMPSNSDSFRLYCDDLRPANILLTASDAITAIIDWEFTYAAPSQFSLDPPWWLLLDTPDQWDAGLDNWITLYEPRLETWISAMKKAEEDTKLNGGIAGVPLSTYMRESWETGRFWLTYVARKSWAFETIFWKYLDERFFGPREQGLPRNHYWKARIDLLSEDERNAMEPFVEQKMETRKERKIVDWDPEAAKGRFAEMLFD